MQQFFIVTALLIQHIATLFIPRPVSAHQVTTKKSVTSTVSPTTSSSQITIHMNSTESIIVQSHKTIKTNLKNNSSIITLTPTPTYMRRVRRVRSQMRPTLTPTPTKIGITSTPKITKSLIPANSIPSTTPSGISLTMQQQFMMDAINEYRKQNGLYAVKPDKYTCSFAAIRAKEIVDNFNHDGFTNRVNSKSLPYPSYHSVTENIAMTSDYKQVVTMWINSPGHAENMRKDTPYVCVAQSGNYFAYEGWKP